MGHLLLLGAIAAVSVMVAYANHVTMGSSNDATMKPNVPGPSVVEQTLQLIKTTCMFDDDKLFMRRLAYVESYDGEKEGTFRDGYHGGIWQVDEHMFDELKTPTNKAKLAKYTNQIESIFGIDWEITSWSDCRKALVSALAARLFLELKLSKNPSITSDITKQARFWVEKYHNGVGNAKFFEDAAKKLDKGCKKRGVDLAFVLDSSGSVGSANFQKMKAFVVNVVKQFDISHNMTQVAVVRYSTGVYTEFNFKRYNDRDSVVNHVKNIRYSSGSTNTHLALKQLYEKIFTTGNGARNSSTPKFTLVLTDGYSNSQAQTVKEAANVHGHDITMFAVGVGRSTSMKELRAIASEPDCLYLLQLDGFSDMDSLMDSILKTACDAPVIISPGEDGSLGSGTMKNGTSQPCKINSPKGGATIKINVRTGGVTFFISYDTYPSESYYDTRVDAVPGVPGVMYLEREGSIFCRIKADDEEETEVDIGSDVGDTDYCKSHDCKNGASCVDDLKNSYTCACAPEYEGKKCEERIKYDCINNSPCTKANVDAGRYFFPHIDETKFVQCGHFTCYVLNCPPGLIFDPAFNVLACVRP